MHQRKDYRFNGFVGNTNTLWPAARVSCIPNTPQTMDSVTTLTLTHTHSNEVGLIVMPHLTPLIMRAETSDRLS